MFRCNPGSKVKFREILPILNPGAGACPRGLRKNTIPSGAETIRCLGNLSAGGSQGAADVPTDRPGSDALLPEFPSWVCMMMRARCIRLIGITVFTVVCVYLHLPACPVSAADGDVVLSAQEWFDKGRFMGEIGNYHKAVEAFSRVIELTPKSAHAYNNRGVAHSELGNYRLAIQDFNRAINLKPREALFRFNRGIAFGREEELELAMKDFAQVVEIDPKHSAARFFLGLIQRGMPGGEAYKGTDNIKVSAQMGNQEAREYLRSRFMGWY